MQKSFQITLNLCRPSLFWVWPVLPVDCTVTLSFNLPLIFGAQVCFKISLRCKSPFKYCNTDCCNTVSSLWRLGLFWVGLHYQKCINILLLWAFCPSGLFWIWFALSTACQYLIDLILLRVFDVHVSFEIGWRCQSSVEYRTALMSLGIFGLHVLLELGQCRQSSIPPLTSAGYRIDRRQFVQLIMYKSEGAAGHRNWFSKALLNSQHHFAVPLSVLVESCQTDL